MIATDLKSDGLLRQNRNLLAWVRNPPNVIFAIIVHRLIDSWTVFSASYPTVLSRAVTTTESKSDGRSQQT
jgi:hypothetical protein